MYSEGRLTLEIRVSQGTKINREGRVHIRPDSDTDRIYIGGETQMMIEGVLTF